MGNNDLNDQYRKWIGPEESQDQVRLGGCSPMGQNWCLSAADITTCPQTQETDDKLTFKLCYLHFQIVYSVCFLGKYSKAIDPIVILGGKKKHN